MFISSCAILISTFFLDPASGATAPVLAVVHLPVTVHEAPPHPHHLLAPAQDLLILVLLVRGLIHGKIGRRGGRGVFLSLLSFS